jgi:hypothetical protein
MLRRCEVKCLCAVLFIFGVATDGRARQEVSGIAGYGRITGESEDIRGQFAPTVGASLILRLHRPEIRIDYENVLWDKNGRLHLVGAGWFIQSRPKAIRPFFQLGWMLGVERNSTQGFQGLAVSAGVTRDVGGRIFIRPEVRWKLIGPGPIMLITPMIGAGYRF